MTSVGKLPLIVVDGPRASGKSSVARGLANHLADNGKFATYLKKRVYYNGIPEIANMWEHVSEIERMVELFKLDYVVLDRLVASEFVMSTYNKRTNPTLLTNACSSLSAYLHERGALQIVLRPSIETIVKRMAERGPTHPSRQWDMAPDHIDIMWDMAIAAIPHLIEITGTWEIDDLITHIVSTLNL